jgi:molecular chaperone IbpA
MKITDNQFPDPWDKHKNPYDSNGKPYPPMPNPHEPWDRKDKWQKPPAPKVITINDLFPSLDRWAIGWLPILDELKSIAAAKPSYPPYDIIDQNPFSTLINVAVAGFTKKDLTITVEERTLNIEGKKDKEAEGTLIHNGIAGRDFKLTFALAEFYEVESATAKDGILAIKLVQNIPDEKKPKVIDIK